MKTPVWTAAKACFGLILCFCVVAVHGAEGGEGAVAAVTSENPESKNTASNASSHVWKAAIGRSTWHLLHSTAAKYPDAPSAEEKESAVNFIKSLEHLYPCEVCRSNLKDHVKVLPPLIEAVNSRGDLSVWLCKLHNVVNEELHKQAFNCSLDALDDRYLVNCGGCGSVGDSSGGSHSDSEEKGPFVWPEGGLFVPTPNVNKHQSGPCKNLLDPQQINGWIQGNYSHVSLTRGSVTVFFFMSQSCHVCHDVAPKLNKMYKLYRERGLNLIGIHASPKGYKSTKAERDGLRQFILEEKIEFPIIDMHAKNGKQPTLKNGQPDWEKAGRTKPRKDSFFAKIFGAHEDTANQEYFTPITHIWKNCRPAVKDPLSGYDIMGLQDVIEDNEDALLWSEKTTIKKKSKAAQAAAAVANEKDEF